MDTVAQRLAKYQRRLRLQGVVAATLLGEVAVFSAVKVSEGDLSRSGPFVVSGAIFLTLVVVAGVLLAVARGPLEWEADLLLRSLGPTGTGGPLLPTMTIEDAAAAVPQISKAWPPREKVLFPITLLLVLGLGALLVVYSWLPVVLPSRTPGSRPFGEGPPPKPTPPPPPSPAAPVPARVELVGLPMSVQFEVDRAAVPAAMRPKISALAKQLMKAPSVAVQLEGHADSDSRSEYNLELSRLRAEAVKSLLVADGLEVGRITVMAYGETKPLGPSQSAADKAQNRRVDIVLVEPAPKPTPERAR